MNKLLLLVFAFLLSSCAEKHLLEELERIDHLSDYHPDAAQIALDSLYATDTAAFTSGRVQAKWIMLDTFCKYRFYKEGKNDSLISIASDYFLQHGPLFDQLVSLNMHGTILCNAGRYIESMLKFKAAENLSEGSTQHCLRGQIYSNLYMLCFYLHDADRSFYAKQAVKEFELCKEEMYLVDANLNMGLDLFMQHHLEDAQLLLNGSLHRSLERGDTMTIVKAYRFLAETEVYAEQNDSALHHLLLIRDQYNSPFIDRDLDQLAILYARRQQRDSVQYYLDRSDEILRGDWPRIYHLYTQATVCQLFGDYKGAYEYQQREENLKDSVVSDMLKHTVLKEQQEFAQQQLHLSESQRQSQMVWIWILVLSVLLLLACCALLVSLKRGADAKYYERLLADQKKDQQMQADALNALRCMKQNDAVVRLRQALSQETKVTVADWKRLDDLFLHQMPAFEAELLKVKPLNEVEWRISQLIKLGFTNHEIALLLHKADSSVSCTTNRLYPYAVQYGTPAKSWRDFVHTLPSFDGKTMADE